MKPVSKIIFVVLMLQLAGCASYFKKKSCEEINWFEHGQKVAMRGQWLNADTTLNECRKVEADIQESQLDRGFKSGVEKYCVGTNTYILGKGGDLFSRDLCEGPQINVLISEHQKGIRDYCAKSNGFTAGTSGKRYQNVCPKDLESGFLPEYRKGRRKYVQSLIDSKDKQVRSIDMDIAAKRNSLSFAKGSLHMLESQKNNLESQKNAAVSAKQPYLVTHFSAQIQSVDTDLSMKRSEVSNLEGDLRNLESSRDKLNQEINSYREELPSLEHP
ncbi:DUF2799 domain-containing protein [Bdellovibrio bacteriovorus]|uniref:DUF2799 domain-containing protein n=1 Tax=Bdellovibrio bacteriovorus TaxID=959 RepID=UPI0021D2FFAD|nr:DUF2799 domain-containing protein [Bdellovibrio bacteriovorus]UXR64121.1 DUF2799 domain-containing protein [Bdellovibrio bacteriovorus]